MERKKIFWISSFLIISLFFLVIPKHSNNNIALASSQVNSLTIESNPGNFMQDLVPQMRNEYNNYLNNIKGRIPRTTLKIYKNSSKEKLRRNYKEHLKEDDYNGILITYFKDEVIMTSSFSDKISNDKLFEIRDQVIEEMEAGESDREFLTEMLKRIAAASAGKSYTPDSMTIYVEDNLGEITDGRFKLYCGDKEFILDINSKEKLEENYKLNFRLSSETVSKIEAAGCEIE
ncbi:MAG: hypothetical protein ABEK36_00725 [Candidatus Aenigmatarchaeota archaeon]